MLFTTSKFKIKTFHSSPYTYARKATGGLKFDCADNSICTSKAVVGQNTATFSKHLMAGYAIIARVNQNPSVYEKRIVTKINTATSLEVDAPFSKKFGTGNEPSPPTIYNYESCPSLAYENFDMRTENGMGVITSDGTNHVYDNVQYSKITTKGANVAPTTNDQAAEFVKHLKVGYKLTMDGITRTVTKIVDNTLLHVDRAFKEGTQHKDYSYRYSVTGPRTGDYHLHWKPATQTGDYHQLKTATDANIYARSMIATHTKSNAAIT